MKNHYDVLSLDKNCSEKDIKESFIKLSKKYHPDKNKNPEAHKKFVEINEAYSVLGKNSSRQIYDQGLQYEKQRTVYESYTRTTRTGTTGTTGTTSTSFEEYCEMWKRKRGNHDMNSNYFTRSKMASLCFCLLLVIVGSGLHAISYSRRRANQSHRIAVQLQESRERRRLGLGRKVDEIKQPKVNQYDGFKPSEQ